MSSFDYGNARLHAWKARLLSRSRIEALIDPGTPAKMLSALSETAYRPVVEAALVRAAGLPALNDALSRELQATLRRYPDFFSEEPAATLICWLLRRYDVYNVKNALRGVSQGVSPETIQAQMLPVGELRPAELTRLARAESSVALIGILATWRSPYARPLLTLQGERPDADLYRRELALDRWWARGAWTADNTSIWREYVTFQIDAANVMAALRLVGTIVEPQRLDSLFITVPDARRGPIPAERLVATATAPDVESALARLAPTPYDEVLREAWEQDPAGGRLSDLELSLDRFWLRKAISFFQRDPLGIGVPLGYLALKVNEIRNLRFVGHGLFLEEDPERIAGRLLFP